MNERKKREWLKFGIPCVRQDRMEFYSVFALLRYAVYAFENTSASLEAKRDFSDSAKLTERIAKDAFIKMIEQYENETKHC